jgi:hypothetical protein
MTRDCGPHLLQPSQYRQADLGALSSGAIVNDEREKKQPDNAITLPDLNIMAVDILRRDLNSLCVVVGLQVMAVNDVTTGVENIRAVIRHGMSPSG